MSINEVKKWIEEWNEDRNDNVKMEVAAYNGYYHIRKKFSKATIVTAKSPKPLWESFCIWRNGYYEGRDE